MQKVSGQTVFTKEEMNNDNVKTVITEMIQNNREQMTHWNIGCGMYKLLECQNNALRKVLESISQTEIQKARDKRCERYVEIASTINEIFQSYRTAVIQSFVAEMKIAKITEYRHFTMMFVTILKKRTIKGRKEQEWRD